MLRKSIRPSRLGLILFVLAGLAFSSVPAETRNVSHTQALLPKAEIGALRFLAKHPEWDGRGAVVAILDTGVDPGAEGLLTTSHGQPKVIDVIDATGSGDVDLSEVRKAADGVLEGLTGRKLKLPPDVNARNGEFRVGMKTAWNLYPDELVTRMKKVRREAWTEAHKKALLKARLELEAGGGDREELQARLNVLQTLEQRYEDPGPVFDCVAYHDGTVWRAVIDTDEDGDLGDEKRLTDFDVERQWGTFSAEDHLNFGVHFYDEGKTLSIVADSGAHGTHVAGIVAANYPNDPGRNGVAPGAQIVGIKIGDTRLASMETGSALLRAATALVRHKCDLANMSYGEPTTRPNKGLIVTTLGELAQKHNVLFLSSAMNSGPALSTIGAPGGVTSGVIGVGAYLSPEMMAAQYSHRENMPAQAYTFTSRGPANDGDMGVAIFAPGGAVAPVPQWTLNRSQQMNGTSMASPNACGGLALLVSALKANKTPYTAASVTRAIQTSAQFVEDVEVFAQGPGLLQVDRAWDHLEKYATAPAEQLQFYMRVLGAGFSSSRGVYLRDPAEVDRPQTYQVFVRPEFPKDSTHKLELEFDLGLTLESTQPWVDVGPSIQLPGEGRNFEIRVDPTKLFPGAHFAEVRVLEAGNPERGPLCRVPITVIRPVPANGNSAHVRTGSLSLVPGRLERHFVAVPPEATTATLELKRTDKTAAQEPVRIRVDVGFSAEDKRFDVHTTSGLLGDKHTDTFPVQAGEMMELCFVRDWRSIAGWTEKSSEATSVEYELTFHSVLPSKSELALPSEGPAVEVTLTAALGRESLSPSGSLTTRRQLVKPARNTLKPGTARDELPDGSRLNILTLEYDFQQAAAGNVTPHVPLLDNLLYDSDYGTALWLLFDSRKKLVTSNDVFPDAVNLPADSYTLKLQMKHPDQSRLESLRDLKLALDRSINASLTFTKERPSGGSTAAFGQVTLNAGESTTAWVAATSSGGAGPDEILIGTIQWTANGPEYAVRSVFPRTSAPTSKDEPAALPLLALLGAKPGDTAGRLAYELQEYRLRQLLALTSDNDKATFETLVATFEKEYPELLAGPYARLRRADDDAAQREHRLPEILSAANAVLAKIDVKAMEAHFGVNLLPEDSKGQAERKRFTELRELLIDTLYRKGRALGYMELPEVVAKTPIADQKAHDKLFEDNFNELRRWVDTTGEKYFLLHVRKERRKGRNGLALQLLLRHIADEPPNSEHAEKRRDMIEALGWTHQLEYERREMLVRFPKAAEPF